MTILVIVACGCAVFIFRDQILVWYAKTVFAVHGETRDERLVNNLADDLRGKPILGQMQQWSTETMKRFDSRTIASSQYSPNWPGKAVVIASNEVPDFIKNYKPNDQPEVAIGVSTNSLAECVIIDWYFYGIIIGTTNREQSYLGIYDYGNRLFDPTWSVYVQPGVHAIWFDVK